MLWKIDFGVWGGGLATLLLKIVINNRVLQVFMVVNNCKKIVDSVSALKNWFWSMGGLAKLLLKIVINNQFWTVFMVVNNCKKIVDYVSALKNWFWSMGGLAELLLKIVILLAK